MVSALKLAQEICDFDLNDADRQNMSRVITAVSNSLTELNYHIGFNIISREFEMPANYQIEVPDDCIEVIKVGTFCNGYIQVFGLNNKLVSPETACGCKADENCPACTFHGEYQTSYRNYYGEAYGTKRTQFPNGFYRWDRQQRRLIFGSGSEIFEGSRIIVEYQTSLNMEGVKLIPDEYKPIIKYKALSLYFEGPNPGQSQFYYRKFVSQVDILKRTRMPSPAQIIAALRGEMMSAPRQ